MLPLNNFPGDKGPLVKGWREWKEAPNEAQITGWWQTWPNAMAALITGKRSGLMVVDVDVKDGKDGWAVLREWEARHGIGHLEDMTGPIGDLPALATTPSGGKHIYLKWPEGAGNHSPFGDSVDVRAEGGYITAPGSIRGDGKRYTWDPGRELLAEGETIREATIGLYMPPLEWITERNPKQQAEHEAREAERQERQIRAKYGPSRPPRDDGERLTKYMDSLLEGMRRDLGGLSDGRNKALNDAAFRLGQRVPVAIDEAEARMLLEDVSLAWTHKPRFIWLATINSGLTAGMARPMTIEEILGPEQAPRRRGNVTQLRPPPPPQDGDPGAQPPEQDRKETPLTQDHVGEAYMVSTAGDMTYVPEILQWRGWNGERWQDAHDDQVIRQIGNLTRGRSSKEKILSSSWLAGAMKMARTFPDMRRPLTQWDADEALLGTPSGSVDTRSGQAIEPNRDLMISKTMAVAPDFSVPIPIWRAFLEQVTDNDDQLKTLLQRFSGYCMTGSVREQKMLILTGEGGNGKGVFVDTIRAIIGDYGHVAPMSLLTSVGKASNSQQYQLAMLVGKRLVTVSEAKEGTEWSEEIVKQLTGGDPINGRPIAKAPIVFDPTHKLMMMTNTMPKLASVNDAIKRRLLVAPFDFKPKRPDVDLKKRLRDEWPGILAWMIEGAQQWWSDGLPDAEVVAKKTSAYLAEQDIVGEWMGQRCGYDKTNWKERTNVQDLYADFKEWTERLGHATKSSPKLDVVGFGRLLSPKIERKQRDAFQTFYVGLTLKHPYSNQGYRDGG